MKKIEELAAKKYISEQSFPERKRTPAENYIDWAEFGAREAQRWIPIEEETPNKFDWVLCRSELHDCYIAPYLGEYGFAVDSNSKITHWRPINLH